MTATADQIEAALLAPWLSVSDGGTGEWTATPYENVGWDNVSLDPATLADPSAWMEVSTSAGTLRAQDIAAVILTGHPTVTVSAHTPLGTGKRAARLLIATAHDLYRGRQITAGTSSMTAYAFSPAVEMPKDGWYKLTTQISFRLI